MHLLPNILNRRIHHGYNIHHFHPHIHSRRRRGDIEKDGEIRNQRGIQEDDPIVIDNSMDPLLESVDQAEASSKTYRLLPIFSGIMVPFAVMLAIPSLTSHWYVRTDEDHVTVETQPNPVLLDIGLAFSIACGVLANCCLVVRFAERQVKWMTLAAIVLLTFHDLINIPTVTIFGIIHRFDDGFTYGQPFWFTVCSTIASTATNFTLIIDYVRTHDFDKSGSGLTTKQRSLMIISIILLTYVSFGSLIQTKLQDITFIDALYFSVVSIESIGFGDVTLRTSKARIFTCFYIAGGLLNIALGVAMARDALLEAAVINFRTRRRMHERERRLRNRWRAAVRWRLCLQGHPIWVHHHHNRTKQRSPRCKRWKWPQWIIETWDCLIDRLALESKDPSWRFLRGPRHRRLNVEALTDSQLHAAALEAGAPLSELLPNSLGIPRQGGQPKPRGIPLSRNPTMDQENDPAMPLTHFRMGGMLSLIWNFAFASSHAPHAAAEHEPPMDGLSVDVLADGITDLEEPVDEDPSTDSAHEGQMTHSASMQEDERSMAEHLEDDEKNAFYTRLSIALVLFIIFWMAGAAIFMKTERWTFGIAIYFCFISFTTVGYGDYSPKTPAGRSIFVMWALLGVATVTILISVISEAYSTRYKSLIRSEVYQATAGTMRVPHAGRVPLNATSSIQPPFDSRLTVDTPTEQNAVTPIIPPISPTSVTAVSKRQPYPNLPTIQELPFGKATLSDISTSSPQGHGQDASTKILAQVASLKSVITVARAPSDKDPHERLDTLISHLEESLLGIERTLHTQGLP